MLRLMRKGQSTAEYAIVIGLVIGAAVAMQIYVKRGIQGKIKNAVDYNDPAATMMTTSQYEPYYSTSSMTASRTATDSETVATGGGVARTTSDTTSRTGTTGIGAVQ